MEDNLILEGLLSMVTELKEKLEAQVTPASREETIERFGAIEQALSRLHTNPAVSVEKLQTIQSQLDDVRNKMQGQQQHIEDTKRISLEIYRNFKIMVDTLNSYKTDKEEVARLPFYQRIYNGYFLDSSGIVYFFGSAGSLFRFHMVKYPFGYTDAAVTGQ